LNPNGTRRTGVAGKTAAGSMQASTSSRYVVYTCILGQYDVLREPRTTSPRVRFICFTDDRTAASKAWELVHLDSRGNNTDLNRRVKMNPHLYLPAHDFSLYVDGNIQILGRLDGLFEKYSRLTEIAAPRHPTRNCIYEEAAACIRAGKGDPARLQSTITEYVRAGFPTHSGLYECGLLFRKSFSIEIIRLMEAWYIEYDKSGRRDQISFPYAAWKCGIKVMTLDESPRYSTRLFRLGFHNHESKLPVARKALLYARLNRHNSIMCRAIADAADLIRSTQS